MVFKCSVVPLLWMTASVPVLAAGHPRMPVSVPPASFLNYHVSNVRELSQEITLDPKVRARLANHFHISEAELTQYVRRNLVLTKLRKGGVYHVACVGRSGREFWIESRLPAGTPIFASRATGHPILKLACGNPMISSLPPGIKTSQDISRIGPPQLAPSPVPATIRPALLPGLLGASIQPIGLIATSTQIAPAVVYISPSLETFVPSTFIRAGVGSFNAIPAILGGLGVAIASSRGGSGANAAPAPVPESSTWISLGAMLLLGGASFVLRRRSVRQQ